MIGDDYVHVPATQLLLVFFESFVEVHPANSNDLPHEQILQIPFSNSLLLALSDVSINDDSSLNPEPFPPLRFVYLLYPPVIPLVL
jgi:hypothetical protein